MAKHYDHNKLDKKWQKQWVNDELYKTQEGTDKPKYYILDMFPYPSGAGLHVGHPKGYIATDIIARMKMMQGFNVLHPMGWDAFGLPAENYAIKNKVHPSVAVEKNVKVFKEQLQKIGFTYDWSREINTTDPSYYKWTQWAFVKMFEKGLAYESEEPIIWCPSCQTGLAMEDLEDGKCERCSSDVERKPMRQWVLKITDYADRLLQDIDALNEWPEPIKEMQRNWIGKSQGAEVDFKLKDSNEKVKVFTTRPDTLFGATFMVLSPEHPLVQEIVSDEQKKEVEKYAKAAAKKSDLERAELQKDKTGIFSGAYAINPVNNEEIPIWIADYVLMGYGTGAIMAVPAHDQRDYEFAKKYNIEIIEVIDGGDISEKAFVDIDKGKMINSGKFDGLTVKECIEKISEWLEREKLGNKAINYRLQDWVFSRQRYWGEPIPIIHCAECKNKIEKESHYINFYNQDTWSKLISGKKTVETRALNPEEKDRYFGDIKQGEYIKAINKETKAEEFFVVEGVNNYKDLVELFEDKDTLEKVYSPAPSPKSLEELEKGYSFTDGYVEKIKNNGLVAWTVKLVNPGVVTVPEDELPVTLPEIEKYEPSGTGESPLATIDEWVNVKCPKCGGAGRRETNTMPQWAGSNWYYLRYIDPNNDKALIDPEKEKHWMPIDFYVGGAEHATRHLIYSRFWHKFLFDIGVVSTDEPFKRLQNVGLIMAEDGRKMSKRWGNVINPDEIIAEFGADAMRVYEMFMGPFDQAAAWDTNGLRGVKKFLDKVYSFDNWKEENEVEVTTLLHKTIKKVTSDIETMNFNTAISQMMIFVNKVQSVGCTKDSFKMFLQLLSPFAPHISEELWNGLDEKTSIFLATWPKWDETLIIEESIEIPIQINGKVRDKLMVSPDIEEKELKKLAMESEKVQKFIEGKEVRKFIYVKGRLVSIVI
jgi:leucyl-tRNA synthetase